MIYIQHILNCSININDGDILTFDDGHYSILKNIHLIQDLDCQKIIFITPNFISLNKRSQYPENKIYYMDDFFLNKCRDHFLTLDEIEILINKYHFDIGMHSYYHDIVFTPRTMNNDHLNKVEIQNRRWYLHKKDDKNILKLFTYTSALSTAGFDIINNQLRKRSEVEFKEYIDEDTEKCIEWFKKYLFFTNKYAFPFFQSSEYLIQRLKYYNISDLYGKRKSYFNNSCG